MVQEIQLRVDPRTAATESAVIQKCALAAGVTPGRVMASLVYVRLRVEGLFFWPNVHFHP